MRHTDRFDSLINYWATRHGVDWLLIKAQIMQESSMNPMAVSSCGAMGLMQLMPSTAIELKVSNVFDPDSNLCGGISYLKTQLDHFPEIIDETERIKFALAAYNAGRGNINKAISLCVHSGKNQDWQQWDIVAGRLKEITGKHSEETLNYVSRILKYLETFQKERPQ